MTSEDKRKIFWILVGSIFALIALIALVINLALPILLKRTLLAELRAAGMEHAELFVRKIGWKQTLLSDLKIGKGGDLQIKEVKAEYSIKALLQGRLDVIALTGLRLNARIRPGGISFGVLDTLFSPTRKGKAPTPALPATVVEIRSSQLDVATPFGQATVPLSVKALLTESNRLQVEAELGLRNAHASLSMEAVLELEPDGQLQGNFWIAHGRVISEALGVGFMSGEVTLEGSKFKIDKLDGRLSFGELKMLHTLIQKATLEVDLVGGRARAKAHANSSDTKTKIWFTSEIDDIYTSMISLSLLGGVEAQTAFWLQWFSPNFRSVQGGGRAAFEIKGTIPNLKHLPTPEKGFKGLQTVAMVGKIDLEVTDVSVPHMLEGLAGAGQLEVRLSERVLTVGSNKGLNFRATRLEPNLFPKWLLTADFRRNLKGPLSLRIGDGSQMPFTLRATGLGENVSFRGAGEAQLNVQDGIRLTSEIDAAADLSENGGIERFNLSHLALTLSNWRRGEAKAALKVADVSIAGTPDSFSGDFNASLSIGNFRGTKLALRGANLTLGGDLEFRNRRLAVMPKKGSLLRVGGARWLEPAVRLEPLTLRIERGTRPIIEADLEDPLRPVLRHQIVFSPSILKLDALLFPDQRVSLKANAPRVRLAGRVWGAQPKYQGEIEVARGDLEVLSHFIALRGLDARLSYNSLSQAKEATASINVKELLDLRNPPFVKALRLSSNMKHLADRLFFTGQVSESTGTLLFDFEGSQDFAHSSGNARFKLHPVSFTPNGNQPQDLFPFLQKTITSASGKVALEGAIDWTPRKVAPNLNLLVEDISIQSDGLKLNGINSAVTIDGLWPPSTPSGQLISVALIDVGLPLTQTSCSFHLGPKGRVFVERAHLGFAGGKIRTERVAIDPKSSQSRVALEVEDVDVERLVTLSKVEGLSATGRLKGTVPLLIKDGSLFIQDGLLEASSEGGTIRYNPREVPPALRYGGEKTQLMLSALRNFRYKSLTIRLNGGSDGDAAVGLHLRGSNPDFFKGRPVEFNLNLSGPLAQILQRSMKLYRLPKTIMKRLEKLGN